MHLSVIIPYYNETKEIPNTVNTIFNYFSNRFEFEIILIDDGYKNELKKIFIKNDYLNLTIIENFKNKGKGFSLTQGLKIAKGEIILFTDADLSTPINQFEKLYDEYLNGFDIVIGSRNIFDSYVKIKQGIFRRLYGKVFNLLVRIILGLNYYDTQCGFKLLNGKKISNIIDNLFIERFCIDVEILYLALKKNLQVKEVGITWNNNFLSSVNLVRDMPNMFCDLIKIKLRH